MHTNELAILAAMSNKYGADPEFVLAGGGNTSFKSEDRLWVKGSGTALATIRPQDFVVLERPLLAQMWSAQYPEEEAQREAAVLSDMMNARVRGENRRPSVETLLHDLFPQKYVLHVHPTMVNGLTCSLEGKIAMQRLLPDALWVDACKPGYILALECKTAMDAYKAKTGKDVQILFLQNHGIFFAADTAEAIDELAGSTMAAIKNAIIRMPDLEPIPFDTQKVVSISPVLRALYGGNAPAIVKFTTCTEILSYDPATKSLSPDHIVYAKAKQLSVPETATQDEIKELFDAFVSENGYKPKIVFVENLGMFSCGMTMQEAVTAQEVMMDAIKVVCYANPSAVSG
jgi:rhamnose utilization protein RhaD (predicted bifunctional aldolase and dehydrogenase)